VGDWFAVAQAQYDSATPRYLEDEDDRFASCPGRELVPNPCRCPCYGCKHHCSAHDPDSYDPEDYEPDPDEERDRRFDDEDDRNWEEC
jgi:hypothetical protein